MYTRGVAKHIALFSIGVVLLGMGAVALMFSRDTPSGAAVATHTAPAPPQPIGAVVEGASSSREVPSGAREYRSTRYGFSLIYPESLSVKEYDEGAGAATITFQNVEANNAHGFQIFITPYAEPKVTEAQFKKDEPSGVRTGEKQVAIDGATGASFFSSNPVLGETAEVWFVHGGYLYEVTTLKPLASWLASIMGTWQFL